MLVEAGHRCAIPTCRYIETDIHHIVPWADCKTHEYENLIALCSNCHRRADRGEIDRKSLRLYKQNLRFIHDKFSQVEVDILFELAKFPPLEPLLWPSFNRILLKRIIEARLIICQPQPIGVEINGMAIGTDKIMISRRGRKFLREIGAHEL